MSEGRFSAAPGRFDAITKPLDDAGNPYLLLVHDEGTGTHLRESDLSAYNWMSFIATLMLVGLELIFKELGAEETAGFIRRCERESVACLDELIFNATRGWEHPAGGQ